MDKFRAIVLCSSAKALEDELKAWADKQGMFGDADLKHVRASVQRMQYQAGVRYSTVQFEFTANLWPEMQIKCVDEELIRLEQAWELCDFESQSFSFQEPSVKPLIDRLLSVFGGYWALDGEGPEEGPEEDREPDVRWHDYASDKLPMEDVEDDIDWLEIFIGLAMGIETGAEATSAFKDME